MTQGYPALTEKEKETLRLLVNGYDAKSMARHLGLSIHTVNERLRDARRKMAVSSSREAARQLRELEGQDPEFLGNENLRDAAVAYSMRQARVPVEGAGSARRFVWIIGGFVMLLGLALLAITSLTGDVAPTPESQSALSSSPNTESAAVSAARQWLAVVDDGDWDESWNATGQSFKSLNTSGKWAEVSENVRHQLGAVLSRKFVSEEYVPAPPYGYQIVRFRTSFTNKPGALETVALVHENDSWKVVGITID